MEQAILEAIKARVFTVGHPYQLGDDPKKLEPLAAAPSILKSLALSAQLATTPPTAFPKGAALLVAPRQVMRST